jgi:hypothetical protein
MDVKIRIFLEIRSLCVEFVCFLVLQFRCFLLIFYIYVRLRHYAARRKVASSRSDKVNEYFLICLILPAGLGPGVYSASDKNEYQKQKNNVSGEYNAAGE